MSPAVGLGACLCFCLTLSVRIGPAAAVAQSAAGAPSHESITEFTEDQIRSAFMAAHQGYSSDEVLIRDPLRRRLVDALLAHSAADTETLDADTETGVFLHLLRLRKSGKLGVKTTARPPSAEPGYRWTAEIAGRAVADRHRATLDKIFADPRLLAELDAEAASIRPDCDAYSLRRELLKLRKTRRLRPELVLKVADWGQRIESLSIAEATARLADDTLPRRPGIYLFRDATGYLYIGEAKNLAIRLAEHLNGSDRAALAGYLARSDADAEDSAPDVSIELHVFPTDSPAKRVVARRAYESELIRSRQPRFNLRP